MVSWCDVIVWFKGCIMSHTVTKVVHTNWTRLCNVKIQVSVLKENIKYLSSKLQLNLKTS